VIFVKQALNCVVWVPYEEKLICGCGKSGTIEIFQLVEGRVIENTTKDKVKVQVQTQMQINKSKSNIVAVGTENGNLQMWRVPWGIFGSMS
jgi:WD40 repeat protein